MTPADRELIVRIAEGDSAAFEELHSRHEAGLLRHVQSMVRDGDAAEDLVQEAFLRAWENASRYVPKASVQAWLYRIATNLALNHIRSASRRREQPLHVEQQGEEEEPDYPSWMADASSLGPAEQAALTEERGILWQMVDGLPPGKRDVLRLVYRDDREIQAVAEELGIPEGTVKSRLHHARRQLADEWQAKQDEGIPPPGERKPPT